MKRALITGASGFVGKHLIKELESNGYEVFAYDRDKMNLLDYEAVHSILRKIRPDYIFHLAGIAFVPTSWTDPKLVMEVNTIGSLNIFEAVRSTGLNPVIQIAGSSEEYGLVHEDECPINENNVLRPMSTYAVSKIAMDFLGYQYFKSYGTRIIRTRAFNHEGYGRGEQYMTSSFAKQLVQVAFGMKQAIQHGNLKAQRDITDVRDMVRAYRLAVEGGESGENYNIGFGKAYSVQEILDKLIKIGQTRYPGVDFKTAEDASRLRPSDVPLLLCDSTKFRDKTGWKPVYSIDETLLEEVKYWEDEFKVGTGSTI